MAKHEFELATRRLRLRPLGASHVPRLHALWTDADVRRFLWDGEMKYGVEQRHMREIHASTDAANEASVRVLERLRFAVNRRATVNGLDTLFFKYGPVTTSETGHAG